MDVTLTRSVGIRGTGYEAGTRLTLPDEDAKALIQMGKAEEAPKIPAVSMETPRDPPPAETPETVGSADMPEESQEIPAESEPMDLPEKPAASGRQGTSRSKGPNQRKK